jgi:hypothetical protein
VLPSIFALIQGWSGRQSASVDPDDPESRYFDQLPGTIHSPSANGDAREVVAVVSTQLQRDAGFDPIP